MQCYEHPDTPAAAECSVCGRPLCKPCADRRTPPLCSDCLSACGAPVNEPAAPEPKAAPGAETAPKAAALPRRKALTALLLFAGALAVLLAALLVYRAYAMPLSPAAPAAENAQAAPAQESEAPAAAPEEAAPPAEATPLPSPIPSAFDLNAIILEGETRDYTHSELAGLPAYELSVLRSGMLALSGRRFTEDPAIIAFFAACDWYTPLYDTDEEAMAHMNAHQLANLDLILSVEEEFGFR